MEREENKLTEDQFINEFNKFFASRVKSVNEYELPGITTKTHGTLTLNGVVKIMAVKISILPIGNTLTHLKFKIWKTR